MHTPGPIPIDAILGSTGLDEVVSVRDEAWSVLELGRTHLQINWALDLNMRCKWKLHQWRASQLTLSLSR